MLYKIEVDGFRSLSNFKLNLHPGVNILIGPNGSGKTNIVSFFEFVSQITSNQLGEAISRVGGAGTVFKKDKQGYDNKISSKLIGIATEDSKSILYEYQFDIEISFDKDDIFFTKQELKLKMVDTKNVDRIYENKINWDFHTYFSYDENSPTRTTTVIEKANKKLLSTSSFFQTL
jgi:AAA15 family ATPase/GTPase